MKIFRRNKYDLYQILRENESIDVEVTNNAIVVNPENKDEVNDLVILLSLMTVGSKDEISFDINDVKKLEKDLSSKQINETILAVDPDQKIILREQIVNLTDLQILKDIYAPLITSAGGLNITQRQKIADFIMGANTNSEFKAWCDAQTFRLPVNIMSMLYYLKSETELRSDPIFIKVVNDIETATTDGEGRGLKLYKSIVEAFEKEGKSEEEKDEIASRSLADFIFEEFRIQQAIAIRAANKIVKVSRQLGSARGEKVLNWFKTVLPQIIKVSKGFDANDIKEFFEVIDSVSLERIMNSGGILQLPKIWKFTTMSSNENTPLDKYASGSGMTTNIGRGEIPLALIVKDSNAEGVGADVSLKGPSGFMVDVHVKSHTGLYEVGDDLTKESSGSSKGPDKSAKFWDYALPFVLDQYAGTLSGEDKTKLAKAINNAKAGTTIANIIDTSTDLTTRKEYAKIFEAANRIMLKFHGPTGKSGILNLDNVLESVRTAMTISNQTYSASLKSTGNLELKEISGDGLCLAADSKKNERLVYVDLDDNRSLMKIVDAAGVTAGTFTAKDLTDQIIDANPEKGHIMLLNNKPNHDEVNQILDGISILVPKFSTQVEELRSLVLEPSPSTNMTNQFTQAIIGNALQNLAKLAPPDILITQDDFASLQNTAGNPLQPYSLRRALLDNPNVTHNYPTKINQYTTSKPNHIGSDGLDMDFTAINYKDIDIDKSSNAKEVTDSILYHGKGEQELFEPISKPYRDTMVTKIKKYANLSKYLDSDIENAPTAQAVWQSLKTKIESEGAKIKLENEEYKDASEEDKRNPEKWKGPWNRRRAIAAEDEYNFTTGDDDFKSNKENFKTERWKTKAQKHKDEVEKRREEVEKRREKEEQKAQDLEDFDKKVAELQAAGYETLKKHEKSKIAKKKIPGQHVVKINFGSNTAYMKKATKFGDTLEFDNGGNKIVADHKKYKLTNILAENCESMILGDPIEQSGRMLDYGRVKSDSEEARMTKAKLFRMAQNSQSLHDRLMDDDDLPEWVQDKITTAEDRLQVAYDYIEYKLHRMKTDGVKLTEARKRRLIKNMLKVI